MPRESATSPTRACTARRARAALIRFARDEAGSRKALADRPPFRSCRRLERRVRNDCAVEVDGNAYPVPWR